jgi:hypothetical protein
MSRLAVPRTLAAGSLVTTATVVRAGVSCFELWAERTPPLVGLAVNASVGGNTQRAQAEFRDRMVALARESAERSWRELRRGVDDFDALTRPRAEKGERPHRPYRVKL